VDWSADVAERHGVGWTAEVLRLDYDALKKRIAGQRPVEATENLSAATAFVELPAAPLSQPGDDGRSVCPPRRRQHAQPATSTPPPSSAAVEGSGTAMPVTVKSIMDDVKFEVVFDVPRTSSR